MDLTGFLINNYLLTYRVSDPGELEVYYGTHQHLQRPVTVQVIRVDDEQRDLWGAQLAAEARFLAQVAHPNVVHVYDIGMEDDGLIYVVTEEIDGQPLDQVLDGLEYLEHPHALRLTKEIGRGIAAFHRKGLLTAELDPASVLVVSGPLVDKPDQGLAWVKLLDLGAGCEVGHPYRGELPTGEARRYLAPEAVRREPLTEAADIYSLGILLRDLLLTGSEGAQLQSGSAVERLVSHATARLPADRPQHITDFLDRLDTAQANWSFGAAIQARTR